MNETGKTYTYNNDHNPLLPADFWFQNPPEGLTLFIVFYTLTCQWSRCLGCNLPSLMSEHHINFRNIIKQVDYIFDYILDETKQKDLRKIIISNNGSILDEDTFSTTALLYFIAKMNIHCPDVKILTIETRPEYADLPELEVISRALKEVDKAAELEVAIGFEAFNDRVRNEYFKKGLDLTVFEKFASLVGKYGFRLKTYFMLKPVPQLSEEEAIADIKEGIDYLDSIAARYNLDINMHLNPTYAAKGTPLADAFMEGNYSPPRLESVKEIIRFAKDKSISLYIGLNDEGLAVPGGSFIREGDEKLIKLLEEFNRSQDYSII
ncbi:MAG: hypothetical protein GY754_25790 [bacterium]|nr:hypothetical protein [bacterium]